MLYKELLYQSPLGLAVLEQQREGLMALLVEILQFLRFCALLVVKIQQH
jgi:hypothetical protein